MSNKLFIGPQFQRLTNWFWLVCKIETIILATTFELLMEESSFSNAHHIIRLSSFVLVLAINL